MLYGPSAPGTLLNVKILASLKYRLGEETVFCVIVVVVMGAVVRYGISSSSNGKVGIGIIGCM